MVIRNPPTLNVIPATSRGCFGGGPCWDLDMFQDIIYISSGHNVGKTTKISHFQTAVTLRWPYHDLWITPLWNTTPTHVTMYTWVGFDRFIGSAGPIIYFKKNTKISFPWQWVYATFSYHPRGQGYHTSLTPGDLVHVCIICNLSCFKNFFCFQSLWLCVLWDSNILNFIMISLKLNFKWHHKYL